MYFTYTINFNILGSFHLKQHVTFATHMRGHWLEFIITRSTCETKSDYYTRVISNNSENPRQFWNCINEMLHRMPAPSLPNHVSLKSFSSNFRDKISLICSTLSYHALNYVNVDPQQINSPLAAFTAATVGEENNHVFLLRLVTINVQ